MAWRTSILPLLLGSAIVCASCAVPRSEALESASVEIETFGVLRELMHGGDTSAVVRLETLEANSDRVGVGALSGLRGEITMLPGEVLVAYPAGPDSSRTVVLSAAGEGAALLATARVPRWQTITLSHDVAWEHFDATLESLATASGLHAAEAFPFIVDGTVRGLEWHVIDGARIPPGASGHAAHHAAAIRHTLDEGTATLVGFYSDHHQGVFTHMDSRTHVHARVPDPSSSGHVEHADIVAGATVRLPAAAVRR
jgi:acetolactate decarboxylase